MLVQYIKKIRLGTFAAVLLNGPLLFAANSTVAASPPQEGNFALPDSQQPGPYVSFGQDIIDQGQTQWIVSPDYYASTDTKRANTVGYAIYGISDSLAMIMTVPYFIKQDIKTANHGHIQSEGLGDIQVQGEYAFYTFQNREYTDNATILAGVKFPTADYKVIPTRGSGSEGYFFGTSFQRMSTKWLGYANLGSFFTTFNQHYQPGNQFLYQLGIGHNLHATPGHSIFSILFEFDGNYTGKTKWHELGVEKNTGENVIVFTPSVFYSTPHWIFQAGPTIPMSQHLLGAQSQSRYGLSLFLTYTMG